MIVRIALCLALVTGAAVGAASAQGPACTFYKVNASVLPVSKDAGAGGNIGALEDGDVACVTRQEKVDGTDWGYISHKLEKPNGRKPVNGWVALRYLEELPPAEIAALDNAAAVAPPATARTPPPAPTPAPVVVDGDADATVYQRVSKWARANTAVTMAIGASFALAAFGLLLFAFRRKPAAETGAALTDKKIRVVESQTRLVVYGWLETLDGNPSRYPLGATEVHIGRDQGNDIRLQNDSISRRHALVQFNSDNRRFVISDLGGTNGVMVNSLRQDKCERSDGDLVQLGDVRLRFRANMELLG